MPPESSSAAPSALPRGFLFGQKYRIERVLGAGATGTVYEATQEREPTRVALKVLHRHLNTNEQVARRFAREAKILSTLVGEHIVQIYETGADSDGHLYMALELIQGLALDQVLSRDRFLPMDELASLAEQLAEALELAHGKGIIHRDLKPSNLMIERLPGGQSRVRVLDFGLAKVLRESGMTTTALTEQNMIFGTPEYMSPEQVLGEEPDPRCDIYAAGCILYELLTGSVPFAEMTAIATMTAHVQATLKAPRARAPQRQIPPALEAVTLHAMARSRDERYPTARDFREALSAARREPLRVTATRPAIAMSIADTALSLALPDRQVDPLGKTSELSAVSAPAPAVSSKSPQPVLIRAEDFQPPSRTTSWLPWALVLLIAALLGIFVGVLFATH